MRIESPILADAVQAANGKLFILGGGWSLYHAASYPVPIQIGLAFMMAFDPSEAGTKCPMTITIEDEAGVQIVPPMQGEIGVGAIPPELPKGSLLRMPMAINAAIQIPRAGKYTIDIRVGSARAELQFDALLAGANVGFGFPGSGSGQPELGN